MTLLEKARTMISAELRCAGHHEILEIGIMLASEEGASDALALAFAALAAHRMEVDGLIVVDGNWLTPTPKLAAQWATADRS